ncbi:protein GLUTAMINE DUMPER 2-like [Canna indica]|uniref:Protein GLUTAMINE DUMPER 2-like n=1 Tax=Canna indica TaxID=4628 RepID=A0AAQ3KM93_9LILI|nr:protein GLUTAMINE DUMPER 2-like [Canna indica]
MRARAEFNATAMGAESGRASGWHSPVPYLFGGLAAMLGLIAFALLLLACSYWRLSGYLDGGDGGEAEMGAKTGAEAAVPVACYEEKVVVIMAGDEKPTYLATPIASRASSFGDRSSDGGEEQKVEECMGNEKQRENFDV